MVVLSYQRKLLKLSLVTYIESNKKESYLCKANNFLIKQSPKIKQFNHIQEFTYLKGGVKLECVVKFLILVNRFPKDYFGASNGFRQGNLLSPLLFIVTTHIFNRMLALGKENQLITGIQVPYFGPNVKNIQYADGTLIFLAPTEECVVNLKRILCCFWTRSGLKINFGKSSLTGVGIPEDLLNRFCSILGYMFCPFQLNTWDCLFITRGHALMIGHQYLINLRSNQTPGRPNIYPWEVD